MFLNMALQRDRSEASKEECLAVKEPDTNFIAGNGKATIRWISFMLGSAIVGFQAREAGSRGALIYGSGRCRTTKKAAPSGACCPWTSD